MKTLHLHLSLALMLGFGNNALAVEWSYTLTQVGSMSAYTTLKSDNQHVLKLSNPDWICKIGEFNSKDSSHRRSIECQNKNDRYKASTVVRCDNDYDDGFLYVTTADSPEIVLYEIHLVCRNKETKEEKSSRLEEQRKIFDKQIKEIRDDQQKFIENLGK